MAHPASGSHPVDPPQNKEEPEDPPPPFPLTDVDRLILSQTDEEFVPHTWAELGEIVGAWFLWFEDFLGLGFGVYIGWFGSVVDFSAVPGIFERGRGSCLQ